MKQEDIANRLHKKSNRGRFRKASKASRLGGAIALTIFGGFFCVLPIMMLVQKYTESDTRHWNKTSCVITASALSGSGSRPSLKISYNYDFEGEQFTGNKIRKSNNAYASNLAAEQAHKVYSVGSQHSCFINPDKPNDAVLITNGPSINWALAGFNSIFIMVGLSIIIRGWVSYLRMSRTPDNAPPAPLIRKYFASANIKDLLCGLFFMAIGLAITYGMLVSPMLKKRASEDWQQVPATVVFSEVGEHRGDDQDQTSYSVDIRYSYSFEEKPYTGNRYSFTSGGHSSGRSAKQKIVSRFPTGKEIEVFIDPLNPYDAVITRELSNRIWFSLIPMLFFVIGLGVFIFSLRSGKRAPSRQHTNSSTPRMAGGEQLVVKSGGSRLKKLWFFLFCSLLWNGLLTGFFLLGYFAGNIDKSVLLFFIGFCLFGLGFIGAFIHKLLALMNPRFRFIINRSDLSLGDQATAVLNVKGKIARIKTISITLRGQEEATYRRGSNTTTSKRAFFEDELLKMDLATGFKLPPNLSLSIPVNSMHSFKARNNAIRWYIVVKGDIPKWPDIDDEIELTILPGRN